MALFKKSPIQTIRYQAHYNTSNEIELCQIDEQTGLALVLVGRFSNVGKFNKFLNTNKISASLVIWGTPNQTADIEYSRKYAI